MTNEESKPNVIDGGISANANPAAAGNKPAVRGPLVEDTSVVGGVDLSGAPVVKPRTPDGRADESMRPTDRRE